MKILILANNDIGLYNFRYELIEELIKQKHQIFISLPYGKKVDDLIEIGCTFIETKFDRHGMNPINEIKLIYTYIKQINEIKPDAILGYTIKPNIYGAIAARKLGVPFIANITGLGTAVEYKSWKQFIFINLYRFAFRDIFQVFFQNTSNRDFFLEKHIINDNFEVLPGSGVNLKKFSPKPYPNSEKIKFTFVSRIMKEKGIDQFIDSAKFIRSRFPDTEFNIYGFCEQEYEHKLKKLEEKNILKYHGLVNNIPSVLEGTHCLIHPTYYPEGMSNVLLEAAASGRPVITTDRPGCKEIVENGKTGFVINEKDSKDLIKKIETFLSLSYEEKADMGNNARVKVEKEFDRKIVISKYITVLNKVNNGKRTN